MVIRLRQNIRRLHLQKREEELFAKLRDAAADFRKRVSQLPVMPRNQSDHLFPRLIVVFQIPQDPVCHLRTLLHMPPEVVCSVFVRCFHKRLGNVVQQHRKPQNLVMRRGCHRRKNMLPDRMAVMRVSLLTGHAHGKLRQKLLQKSQLPGLPQLSRMIRHQQLFQLHTDALRTHLPKIRSQQTDSLPGGFLNPVIQLRGEADRPHHPECILGEPLHRIADGTDYVPLNVTDAVKFIHQSFRRAVRHRIDREIAPLQVLQEACRKGDIVRMPSVRVLSVNPVGCHLIAFRSHHHRDGSVLNPGVHRPAEKRLRLLRPRRGRDIPVIRPAPEEAVPDTAAHDIGFLSRCMKLLQNPCRSLRNFNFQLGCSVHESPRAAFSVAVHSASDRQHHGFPCGNP